MAKLTDQQKQQLVDVYKRAEQEGDTAAMGRVRDALAADRSQVPQTEDEVANAQIEAQAGERNANRSLVQGLFVEGPQRILGGLRQAGGAFQDAYNLIVKGKPYREPDVRNPDGSITRGGYRADSKFEQATVLEGARRQLSQLEAQESGMDPMAFGAGAMVGETVVPAAGVSAALPRATTLTGNMIREAIAGGAQAATQFDVSANDTAFDVIAGASLPAAVGGLTALKPAMENIIARGLRRTTEGSRTDEAVKNAQAVMPDFQPTLAQRTGIPELATLEQAAYNSDLVKHYADQSDQFVEDVENIFRQPLRPGQNLDTDFQVAQLRAEQLLAAQKQRAAALWQNGMANVRGLTPKSGPKNVPARNLVEQFQSEREASQNVLRHMARLKVSPRTIRALEQVLDPQHVTGALHPSNAGVSVDTFADILQGLSTLGRESKDPTVRGFAARMRNAIDKDIVNLQSYNGPALPAVNELLQVRTEYQRAKALELSMRRSAAFKLLGVGQKAPDGKVDMPTSDELVTRFSAMGPERQRSFRAWAENNSPDILNTMRQQVITNATRASRTIGPASGSQQDLQQLTDALFDQSRGFDLRTSGLWGKADQAKFEGIRDGLRVIANQNPRAGKTAGTPIKSEDIAINLISRSGPFMARQLSRLLYSDKAANFFTDPRAYEYLTTIRSTSGASNIAARAALMELLQTEYEASPLQDSIDQEVARQRGQ